MQSGLVITEQEFWQNTYRSVNNTYCWLKLLEGKNYTLIDDAVNALNKLITHGQSIEQVINYKAPNAPFTSRKHQHSYAPVSYQLEPNWTQVDDNTIHISLGEGLPTAIAIAVNTEEQLDEMIKEVYAAPYIAVDCEFQGQKKALPELKLLQIGVSNEKGYAIQVDKIGPDIISKKIRPILEDQDINVIGWSFRSDGLAIEGYIKNIDLAPVLDLQAKLKSIAVEQMNLGTAMSRFASDWVGQAEFQKAKQYGTQFNFTGENCIWTYTPLPPRALVYAVFDVLSVIALHESTLHHETVENHYWPFTITKTESPKTIDNWHRLRAKGINSPVGGQNIISSPLANSPKPDSGKGKEIAAPVSKPPSASIITTLGDGYDDTDARYKRDLEIALEKSKREFRSPPAHGEGRSGGGDRVVAVEDFNYSDIASELESSYTVTDRRDSNLVFSSHVPQEPSNAPKIVEGGWGTEPLDEQPFLGSQFKTVKNEVVAKKSPLNVSPASFTRNTYNNNNNSNNSINNTSNSNNSKPISKWNNEPAASPSSQWNNEPAASPSPQWNNEPSSSNTQWNNEPSNTQWKQQQELTPNRWGDQINHHKNNNQWNNGFADQNKSQWAGNNTTKEKQYNASLPPSNSNNSHRKQYSNASNETTRSPAGYSSSPRNIHASPRLAHQPTPVQSSPRTIQASPRQVNAQANSWNSPKASPNNNATQSPNINTYKPDKSKYSTEFKNRITVGNQGGSFTTHQPVGNEVSSADWKSFVDTSKMTWDQKIDIPLTAIAELKSTPSNNTEQPESTKFNTTVRHDYSQNNIVGTTKDAWAQEERPDTMEIPLPKLPIRETFGPRVMNPDDDMSSDDDDYEDDYDVPDFPMINMNKMGVVADNKDKTSTKSPVMKLPTYVDGHFIYSNDGEGELSMLRLSKPEHLDMILIPEKSYTVTICYHFAPVKDSRVVLKALQLFISTGESYTAILDQCCFVNNLESVRKSKFGYLLTDPGVKRICWAPQTISGHIEQKIGFSLGKCVDLSERANADLSEEQDLMSFIQAVEYYLSDWPELSDFKDAKKDFEELNTKKFSSSCWDRDILPTTVLTYSAFQGLAANELYLETLKKIDIPDDQFMI